MQLKLVNFVIITILLILFLSGCNLDGTGFICSSDVDLIRFKNKDSLHDFNAPHITDKDNYSFLVITDTHYYDHQLGYFKDIEKHREEWGISFIVITGDLVQDGRKKAYNLIRDDMKKTDLPIYPLIGNHDLYNNGFDIYKKYFGRTIYEFRIGDTHYIFLDTANGTLGYQQRDWLENKLKNCKCKNKILFSHYSPTDKELESPTAMSYPDEANYIIDLCDKYNVDYFICGHLHTYDYKKMRGTKYIVLANRGHNEDCFLKMTVKNGKLKHKVF